MSRTLRCAVIGLGWAGTVHCRVLRELEGVTLVAVADADARRRAAVEDVPAVATVAELTAHRLDYCVVATPTATHEEIGMELARAGVHPLIEKPLASSLPAALRLTTTVEAAGLVGSVGHTERRNGAVRALRSQLAEGGFGQIYQVATRRQGPFPPRITDVGVARDLAIHDVDLTAFVFGEEARSVTAHAAHVTGHPHEDAVTALCRYDSRLVAVHHADRVSPFKERLVVVHTERGCLVADALSSTLTHYANGSPTAPTGTGFGGMTAGPVTVHRAEAREPFVAEHEAMRDAVLGRPADIVTLREGARAVAVVEAMLASSDAGGATVALGPLPRQPSCASPTPTPR